MCAVPGGCLGDFMPGEIIRVGFIDDHDLMRDGFAFRAQADALQNSPPIVVTRLVATVDAFFADDADDAAECDVVALDLSLADGSRPGDNVARLTAAGCPVLIYSALIDVARVQDALANGALGFSKKSDDPALTFAKLRLVAAGETIDNQELARMIEMDQDFVQVILGEREQECLSLYADGLAKFSVARRMGVTESTVKKTIERIRQKYAEAGRPADDKVDLFRRAVEDGILPPVMPIPRVRRP